MVVYTIYSVHSVVSLVPSCLQTARRLGWLVDPHLARLVLGSIELSGHVASTCLFRRDDMTINPIQSDLIWYHFFPGEKPALEGGSRGAKPVIHCLRATEMTRLNNENEWRWTRLGIWYAVRDTLVSTDLLIWQDNSGVYASWFMGTKQVVIADDAKMWTNEMDIIRQQEFAFDLVRCCPSNGPMSRTDLML